MELTEHSKPFIRSLQCLFSYFSRTIHELDISGSTRHNYNFSVQFQSKVEHISVGNIRETRCKRDALALAAVSVPGSSVACQMYSKTSGFEASLLVFPHQNADRPKHRQIIV